MRINLNTLLDSLAEWFMQLFFDPMYFLKPAAVEVQSYVEGSITSFEEEDVKPLFKIVRKMTLKPLFKPLNKKKLTRLGERFENNVKRFEQLLRARIVNLSGGVNILMVYYDKSIFSN